MTFIKGVFVVENVWKCTNFRKMMVEGIWKLWDEYE